MQTTVSPARKASTQSLRGELDRARSATFGGIKPFAATLLASTALVGFASVAMAQDRTIDGTQEQITANTAIDDLIVGDALPNSTLVISSGAEVDTDLFTIGVQAGSEGTITVTGAGSELTSGAGSAFIGSYGDGTLNVLDGARVSVDNIFVGRESSSGTLTISGTGSSLTADSFVIGLFGTAEGRVDVASGGALEVSSLSLGSASEDSEGHVTISGASSVLRMTDTSDSIIGRYGTGTLEVNSGGKVHAAGGLELGGVSFDSTPRGNGTVTISGSGSAVYADGNIDVGLRSTGTLNINDGGYLHTDGWLAVGRLAGSTGTVTVSGASSKLVQDSLTVGVAGSGTLSVLNGASVTASDSIRIGSAGGSSGAVTVSGSGSKLTHSTFGSVFVGVDGSGTLTVRGGGQFETDQLLYVAATSGSEGDVIVSGSGSKLDALSLLVSDGGTANLSIMDGASATASVLTRIGNTAGAVGTVLVSGTGSKLTTDRLTVGATGAATGTLTVSNGASVAASGATIVGDGAGSTGRVTVTGSGSILIATGNLEVGSDGTGTLNISGGGEASGDEVFVGNAAGSSGTLTVSGTGSKFTAEDELRLGVDGEGTLTLANGGTLAGAVQVGLGAGSTGTLNIGAASGETAQAAGAISGLGGGASSVSFGSGAGTLVFNHTGTDYNFDSQLFGTGTINQLAGVTRLTGTATGFTGTANVSGGTLSVESAFGGAMNVLSGGTLAGTGSVGALDFADGATYQVDLNDATYLSSTAGLTVDNGAKVTLAGVDLGKAGTRQTILSGTSRTGEFGSLAERYLFYDAGLSYTATAVLLDFGRNSSSFADFAVTGNQQAVAPAVEGLGAGNPIYDEIILSQSSEDAQNALNQLTGEANASLQSAVIQGTGAVGSMMMNRVDGAAESGVALAFYAGDGSPTQTPDEPIGMTVWGQTFGTVFTSDGGTATSGQTAYSGGLFTGAERELFDGFTAGVLAGYGRTHSTVDGVNAFANVDSFTLGAYAGRSFGDVRASFGTSYSINANHSSRDVTIGAFTDTLTADYLSGTFQALAEVGYQMGDDIFWYEPFTGLSVVNVLTESFTESGGAAALTTRSSSQTLGVATLGVHAGGDLGLLENGTKITYDANLGWQHAFGEVTPQKTSSFASGSQAFTISGTPMDQNTAVLGAAVKFNFAGPTDVTLSYQGAFGQSSQNNTVSARLAGKF